MGKRERLGKPAAFHAVRNNVQGGFYGNPVPGRNENRFSLSLENPAHMLPLQKNLPNTFAIRPFAFPAEPGFGNPYGWLVQQDSNMGGNPDSSGVAYSLAVYEEQIRLF